RRVFQVFRFKDAGDGDARATGGASPRLCSLGSLSCSNLYGIDDQVRDRRLRAGAGDTGSRLTPRHRGTGDPDVALQQARGIHDLRPLTQASTGRRDAENERSHHALRLVTSCLSRDRLSMPLESKKPLRSWCPLPGMFRLWCRKWPISCAMTPMKASP